MIRDQIRQLKTGPRDLRKFGLTLGGVGTVVGLWGWLRDQPFGVYGLAAAALLIGLGLAYPRGLREVYLGWMTLAIVLGHLVSTMLLVVFYFLVVTPLGLLARCFGKDFLNRRFDPHATTYWLPRDGSQTRPRSRYEQQF